MTESTQQHLMEPAELADCLQDPDTAVFDCRFNLADPEWGRAQYRQAHIPGACYAHLDEDLSSPIRPDSGRHPLPDPERLMARLGGWGVGEQTRVIAYDDMGGAFAVRLWWLLRWLGHERVALLDGGLQAWVGERRPLDRSAPRPKSRRFEGTPVPGAWVSTRELERNLETQVYQLIDARTPERFHGEEEPIDPVAGHIPGAINLPLAGNLDPDGRFQDAGTLRHRFLAGIGDRPPGEIVHSCGSGVNACHNLLAMEIAGLPGSRLYAGSWSEWIRSPVRPVAMGEGTVAARGTRP